MLESGRVSGSAEIFWLVFIAAIGIVFFLLFFGVETTQTVAPPAPVTNAIVATNGN